MKYLKFLVTQCLMFIFISTIIWVFNGLSLWGNNFITRSEWNFWDIFVFVVSVNVAVSPFKLSHFST